MAACRLDSSSTRPDRRQKVGRSWRSTISRESWERFRDEILMPRMAAGIEGGFPTPPEETTFMVDTQVTA
jgi:hypothetical protein